MKKPGFARLFHLESRNYHWLAKADYVGEMGTGSGGI